MTQKIKDFADKLKKFLYEKKFMRVQWPSQKFKEKLKKYQSLY